MELLFYKLILFSGKIVVLFAQPKRYTLPELNKLNLLSNLFNISINVLVKDELDIDIKIDNNMCYRVVDNNMQGYFEVLLIKQSISDENIFDVLNINKLNYGRQKLFQNIVLRYTLHHLKLIYQINFQK